MSEDNAKVIITKADTHVANFNRLLKSAKSDVMVDFIRVDNKGIIAITNKVASTTDMKILENYIDNIENIGLSIVNKTRLPQSKSYLKILGIPYFNNKAKPITQSIIEDVLKNTHIFNNITLASRPRIIKASPKSDQVVIWIDIWDSQNGAKAKKIINRSFNVGCYIATARATNINPSVLQCKNC